MQEVIFMHILFYYNFLLKGIAVLQYNSYNFTYV